MIEYVLFDAANTLIHKPELWTKMDEVLTRYGYNVDLNELKLKHKLLSEVIKFPDVTSEVFYNEFNTELLNALGIIETKELLSDIFQNCKYLPWVAFEDTEFITALNCEVGVLSNFNTGLTKILKDQLPQVDFKHIFISEEEKVSKPDVRFFEVAIDKIGLSPNKILYIGDSLKLDVMPALKMGLNVKLIDREDTYKSSKFQLKSFKNINLDR